MATGINLTEEQFFDELIKKYGAGNLTRRNYKEQYTNIPLILVYFKDSNYKKPKKSMKDMSLEELREAALAQRHVGTYNKKEGLGFFL